MDRVAGDKWPPPSRNQISYSSNQVQLAPLREAKYWNMRLLNKIGQLAIGENADWSVEFWFHVRYSSEILIIYNYLIFPQRTLSPKVPVRHYLNAEDGPCIFADHVHTLRATEVHVLRETFNRVMHVKAHIMSNWFISTGSSVHFNSRHRHQFSTIQKILGMCDWNKEIHIIDG